MADKFVKKMTPEFRVSFPYLFKKEPEYSPGDKTYFTVVALFDKSVDLSSLKKLAANAAKEKWGDKIPKKLKSPFRDGNDKDPDKYPMYQDCTYVKLKSGRKPGVVDANTDPIIEESEIYGGCYGRATVTARAYGGPGTKFAPGVTLDLQNFQKARDGEPFGAGGGDAADDFEPIDNGSEDPRNYEDDTEEGDLFA